jgi:hypothetical protein
MVEIIEEGQINDKTYEDITVIYEQDNGERYIVTYQIKFSELDCFKFNRSNDGIFKTITNENNMEDNVREIHFAVSCNKLDTTYTKLETLSNSNENEISKVLYDKIMSFKDKPDTKGTQYKKCIEMIENFSCEDILNYFCKFIFDKLPNYNGLIRNIETLIKSVFNTSNPTLIFCVRYKIFDKFEKKLV